MAERCLRVAAAGDIHCGDHDTAGLREAFEELAGNVDLVLLAGDLTTHGEPDQAAAFAGACAGLELTIYAVLGNHDWHADRHDELVATLEQGGIRVLERDWAITHYDGFEVGIVGVKGFVGGFAGSHLPDFGEPLLREVYGETSREVAALEDGLRAVATCDVQLVLMHYAPTAQTIVGEPPGIAAFLGTDRLAAPIIEHEPDLVLHGHAHAGTFAGTIGTIPVYNVAVPVTGQTFWRLELDVDRRARPLH